MTTDYFELYQIVHQEAEEYQAERDAATARAEAAETEVARLTHSEAEAWTEAAEARAEELEADVNDTNRFIDDLITALNYQIRGDESGC